MTAEPTRTFTYVRDTTSGDWEGWYIDGRLAREDHSVDATDVLDIMGITYDYVEAVVESGGRLPALLEAVTTKAQHEARLLRDRAAKLRSDAEVLETEAGLLEEEDQPE